MAKENKTKPTAVSVESFLEAIPDETRRSDCHTLARLMKRVVGEEPRMWGSSIVGFGDCHYKYASGHEGDTCLAGFSPRKNVISVYMTWDLGEHEAQLARLGKHKAGKGCLYINKLADVDLKVLEEMLRDAIKKTRARFPAAKSKAAKK